MVNHMVVRNRNRLKRLVRTSFYCSNIEDKFSLKYALHQIKIPIIRFFSTNMTYISYNVIMIYMVNHNIIIDMYNEYNKYLKMCAMYGQTNDMRLLISYSDITYNHEIYTNMNGMFIWVCDRGRMDSCKWLVNYGYNFDHPINIHAYTYISLVWARERNHTLLVNWLYRYANSINRPIPHNI